MTPPAGCHPCAPTAPLSMPAVPGGMPRMRSSRRKRSLETGNEAGAAALMRCYLSASRGCVWCDTAIPAGRQQREIRVGKIYAGPIIDAHHHLWDLGLKKHPWLSATSTGKGKPWRTRPFAPELSARRLSPRRRQPRRRRHRPCRGQLGSDDCVGETRWLEDLDKSRGVATRYVARVPLGQQRGAGACSRRRRHIARRRRHPRHTELGRRSRPAASPRATA